LTKNLKAMWWNRILQCSIQNRFGFKTMCRKYFAI